MKIKAVLNRDGGTFKTTDMQAYCESAARAFAARGHDLDCTVVAGAEIVEALEAASHEAGIEALLAGGGDGTISTAAGVAWKAGMPLGIIPAGTMNLFARSLKLPLDIWKVLDTLSAAAVADVDIATANGRPFVHQFSAGLHARMVRMRNQMNFASRLGKIRASTSAAFGVMLDPPRFEVIFDIDGDGRSDERPVSAISVSNNPLGNNSLFFADRVDTGRLGVYLTEPLEPTGVGLLAFDIIRGKFKENQAVTASTAEKVHLHFPNHRKGAACVLDGELLRMPADVEIRIHAGQLKVFVPPAQPQA
ncbi:diacylglycerol kinase family enzyme [Peteryoungia aggregata LMG 23059]|uniref:Diacylglycerol kinase family enzyme n=1 Tax=Peteryoungia aggregata LMG 23059 TaxID=1368425 RepID=A0ABU0GCM6_9HYPH|nr:diacylglycerol kinase family protein [Peteryoungia aggregata]MDQ0423104.1 diacylglycerol kinase family enzyme [Peteryoungia aggregata LMG 23059]